ncbi:uncharacterized protein LY79DRAFT_555307 [Colletotrichum navitas]|uniref:Uncharacterized protein n=1 Tax=Colletotrichum navitas TaxID=681940 RepID=A0AAD8PYV0_9PEZI|nr:uncharacterized protein LY79DRAFT_555307 [Colletotrichum navitas]KAK1590182.1 hypothetical protein LY79DRAFT_555307 [Colletotrichum navitas]
MLSASSVSILTYIVATIHYRDGWASQMMRHHPCVGRWSVESVDGKERRKISRDIVNILSSDALRTAGEVPTPRRRIPTAWRATSRSLMYRYLSCPRPFITYLPVGSLGILRNIAPIVLLRAEGYSAQRACKEYRSPYSLGQTVYFSGRVVGNMKSNTGIYQRRRAAQARGPEVSGSSHARKLEMVRNTPSKGGRAGRAFLAATGHGSRAKNYVDGTAAGRPLV